MEILQISQVRSLGIFWKCLTSPDPEHRGLNPLAYLVPGVELKVNTKTFFLHPQNPAFSIASWSCLYASDQLAPWNTWVSVLLCLLSHQSPLRESQAWAEYWPFKRGQSEKVTFLLRASVPLWRPDDWVSNSTSLCSGPSDMSTKVPFLLGKDTAMSPKCYLRKMSGTDHHILLPTLAAKATRSFLLSMDMAPSCPEASASSGQSWGDKALSSLVRRCQPVRAKSNIFKGSSSEEAEPQRVLDWLEGMESGNRYHEARRERLDHLMGSCLLSTHAVCFLTWQSVSSSELMCTAYLPSSLCSRLPSRI